MLAALLILGAVAVGLFVANVWAIRKAAEAQARAEHEAHERERSERMAHEMLKEKSVEDTARDLDAGEY